MHTKKSIEKFDAFLCMLPLECVREENINIKIHIGFLFNEVDKINVLKVISVTKFYSCLCQYKVN
jgi:hypothetical protein